MLGYMEDLGMISNISSRYRCTAGIFHLVEFRKLGKVHCATLKSIKSAFILGRRNTFFEMEKKLDYQERENEVSQCNKIK